MSKNNIRKEFRQKRLSLNAEELHLFSQKICQNIRQSSMYQSAKKIGLYIAIENEVNLNSLHIDKNKNFYLPVVQLDWQLRFYPFHSKETLVQKGKLLEPVPKENSIELNQLDLVLVPLIAFDKKGHRIGSGKGCYDKTFKNLISRPILIGVGYSFQEINEIKSEAHDIQMNYIMTETDCYHCT